MILNVIERLNYNFIKYFNSILQNYKSKKVIERLTDSPHNSSLLSSKDVSHFY